MGRAANSKAVSDGRGQPSARVARWRADLAERVIAAAAGAPIVCASGISPSGPIHLGNLREVMTAHLVAETIRARGHTVTHLHSWDDYDRLRKIPSDVDPAYARYVGAPLSEIPDPHGTSISWAQHYIDEFMDAVSALGISLSERRQSQLYRSGCYNPQIRRAMDERNHIFAVLEARQTPGRNQRPLDERRRDFYPFRPYCEVCGHDSTSIISYGDGTVSYSCVCGHQAAMSLADGAPISGKLLWKVDWPMRWAQEHVTFEPAGEDHHAPSAGFAAGSEIVSLFGGHAPLSVAYSFVAASGATGKMSSSAGAALTPADALRVLEPAMVRWLYLRRLPSQGFAIDFSAAGVQRLYDEWDRFAADAQGTGANALDRETYRLAVAPSTGALAASARPVSFRLLAAVADITQGNRQQMGRVLAEHLGENPAHGEALLGECEPRLSLAAHYTTTVLPASERTIVRSTFSPEEWGRLNAEARADVGALAEALYQPLSLTELTSLVYAIPKRRRGLTDDAAVTPELKQAQRDFFAAVYRLLIGRDTGPRLPTLLLSVGAERARTLLGTAE